MIGIGAGLSFVMYFTLYIIPISPFIKICEKYKTAQSLLTYCGLSSIFLCRLLFLNPGNKHPPLYFRGGWLLTHPDEDFDRMTGVQNLQPMPVDPDLPSHTSLHDPKERTKVR